MNRWMQLLTVGSLAFAAGTWQQDVARRTPGPAIESFVLSDLIAQGQWKPLPEPWVLEPSSHQLQQGSAVVLRDVRRSGDELALTVWTGLEGYENNVVTLRFVFDPRDPLRPRVGAQVRWGSCTDAGYFEEPHGRVYIWKKDAGNWDGTTPARITYALYDTVQGNPDCVHGEIDFDPGRER